MEKKIYTKPEINEEIVELDDVIAVSNGGEGGSGASTTKTLKDLFGF